jgi:DNA-binding NtrC family response regulator
MPSSILNESHATNKPWLARGLLIIEPMPLAPTLAVPGNNVLVLVEDAALTELLLDALADAGHRAQVAAGPREVEAALGRVPFHAAIIDLDTRARNGPELVRIVRRVAPSTVVIALLPCGGLPLTQAPPPYHLAIEKPARLGALLSALAMSHTVKHA